jgi:hypothetical protein
VSWLSLLPYRFLPPVVLSVGSYCKSRCLKKPFVYAGKTNPTAVYDAAFKTICQWQKRCFPPIFWVFACFALFSWVFAGFPA